MNIIRGRELFKILGKALGEASATILERFHKKHIISTRTGWHKDHHKFPLETLRTLTEHRPPIIFIKELRNY